MLLTDYLRSECDITWAFAKQCGVRGAVIRLPESPEFDIAALSHWRTLCDRFTTFGFTPVVVEPIPNHLHEHIKRGDALRDQSIDSVIQMMSIMDRVGIRLICFNFMAYLGWLRTSHTVKERGGALVSEFNLDDFSPIDARISEKQLWDNYTYFIRAVIPYAERYNITLALHPDDPPICKLGDVCRIMTSPDAIEQALRIGNSSSLGLTMCQATFSMMDADLEETILRFAKDIRFIHFRNLRGKKELFRETFHDNGMLNMGRLLRLYRDCGIDVPIRVDHVPNMAGENVEHVGYDALGRLFAIGYLKGLLEGLENGG